jgi:8-oxo-dGTP pyrophosphatase MutT (NUDIX family)
MPKRIHEQEVFVKGRFTIKDVHLELDNESKVIYQYWDKADTAMIVPITSEGDVIFITEYQVAFDVPMLSLPKGRIEKGEDPEEIANKELQEEIGYKAHKLNKIATLIEMPGYISGKTHVYLARDLV